MAATESRKSSRSGRIVSAVAAVVGVALLMHSGWNWIAGRRLAQTIHIQAAAGVPMALKDLLPQPIPDRQNAAAPMQRAFALIRGENASSGVQGVAGELLRYHDGASVSREADYALPRLSVDRREVVSNLVAHADLAPVYALLEAAAEGMPAQFPVDYSRGAAALLPHLAPLRNCVQLLSIRAWVRADAGDSAGALNDLRRCLRLTRGLAQEPTIMSQLTRAACDGRTCRLLRDVVVRLRPAELDAAQLWGLVAALEEVNDPGNVALVRAIDGERIIFGGWLFLSFLDGRGEAAELEALGLPTWVRYYARYPSRPMLKDDARVYLERMVACREAAMSGDVRKLQTIADRRAPLLCPLTRRILPAMGGAWRAVATRQAFVQLADLGLRLVLYAQSIGTYPESLDALDGVAVAPLCPFGQPVVYRHGGAGFVMYSVGANGDDDGGVERLADGRLGDCVWR